MRIMLATTVALLVSGCTDATVDEPTGDDIDYGDDGKEDSAGATLCDPLPAASKQLCLQIPNNGWRNALRAELTAPYFEPLAAAVAKARAVDAASDKVEDNVYPAEIDTFAALRRVSPGRVKAVVVGQDPYIGVGQAMGMSFSVASGLAVPPSLDNIYAELVREAGDPALADALPNGFVCPENGDLTAWARQGVFLINAILTVRHGAAGSHADFGWQSLTDAILAVVRDRNKDQATAYLLWGAFARAKVSLIGTTNPKVLILEAAHPSPLAHGFYGNGHFAKANTFLADQGRTPIEWSLPAPAAGTTTKHSCTAR